MLRAFRNLVYVKLELTEQAATFQIKLYLNLQKRPESEYRSRKRHFLMFLTEAAASLSLSDSLILVLLKFFQSCG